MFDFESNNLNSLSSNGAFLTAGEKPNPMTVSWGFIGQMWGKPVVIAPVRNTRYTMGLLDASGEFTLSIPQAGQLKAELTFCGTHSGRDTDKVAETKLPMLHGDQVNTYYVAGCRAYECRVLCRIPLTAEQLGEQLDKAFYSLHDYHTLFVGEIIAVH